MSDKIKIAVLDDYQQVALSTANWSVLNDRAAVSVYHDHLNDETELVERLLPFDVICVMRERTPLNRQLLSKLPNLKLIVSTGRRNASIDIKAVEEFGIILKHTEYIMTGAPEMTWALLMAIARNIPHENADLCAGGWQTSVGADLSGKTMGIIGMGNIGQKMAVYAKAFDMKVIAWSENLTAEKAAAAGAELVSKEALFRESDFITVHLVLSDRSRGIIDGRDLELMKPAAYFINTSRGSLVNEQALINILLRRKIKGAALDVFDTEPLPLDHPFRTMNNVLATPHLGYVTEATYKSFYEDTVRMIREWLDTE